MRNAHSLRCGLYRPMASSRAIASSTITKATTLRLHSTMRNGNESANNTRMGASVQKTKRDPLNRVLNTWHLQTYQFLPLSASPHDSENLLRVQHNLAEHLALLQILVGDPDVFQWKDVVDHGLQASGKYVPEDFVQFAHRPHVRTEQRKLARKQETQIDFGFRTGRSAARDKSARGLERLHALVPGSGADVLEDDVHAFKIRDLANLLRNLLLVVVDDVVRAQF